MPSAEERAARAVERNPQVERDEDRRRGAATASILITLNLWIALDSARGALLSRWQCLLWPSSTCMGATWLIPTLLWLGVVLLGAFHAARRRAAGKA